MSEIKTGWVKDAVIYVEVPVFKLPITKSDKKAIEKKVITTETKVITTETKGEDDVKESV